MAHRLLQDPEASGWERSDFPIVCESCLGPNPYVRMQRVEYGGECHISKRPYTVFRWRPGNEARYKKTIICQEVAKAKNVCQVCLLDLDYNLPVQVRDTALGTADESLPESDVGKEFQLQRLAEDGALGAAFANARPTELIHKLQRTTPYYKRNRAQICSFYVRGECKRGAECPYRHEMPIQNELSDQNIKDRYYGTNDPVAKKMLDRAAAMQKLTPPEDASITTLYVGGLPPGTNEEDIKDRFYSYGEIRGVCIMEARSCAFVTFAERRDAERAAEALSNQLMVKGARCRLMWGRPQAPRPDAGLGGEPGAGLSGTAGAPAMVPPQLQRSGGSYAAATAPDFFGLAGGPGAGAYYPSMDAQQMGSRVAGQGEGKRGPQGGMPDAAKRMRVAGPGPVPHPGMAPPGGGYGMPMYGIPVPPTLPPPRPMAPPTLAPPRPMPMPPRGPPPAAAPATATSAAAVAAAADVAKQ